MAEYEWDAAQYGWVDLSGELARTYCERCEFHYQGLRRPGERCNDLSWIPGWLYRWASVYGRRWAYGHRGITLREHRRLMCKGRVWLESSGKPHWTHEQLAEEHQRLLEAIVEPRMAMFKRYLVGKE